MSLLNLSFILAVLFPVCSQATDKVVVSCKTIIATRALIDGIAGWGTKLLPAEIFAENSLYQTRFIEVMNSDSTIVTPYWWVRGHPYKGRHDNYMTEWSSYFAKTIRVNKEEYDLIINGVAHNLRPLEFRNSGTEANNYFYEIASHVYRKRTGKTAKRPQMLFFGSPSKGLYPYGGTSGRTSEVSIRYIGKPEDFIENYLVRDVQTKYYGKIPASELRRLKADEEKALGFIRKQVANDSLEIGGIFLEPISVSKGLHFFRPEFLLKLRALADELGVPIMADEVFTGGGRTGQFWGFQNYKDFYPDLISFGKGLELKGVGWIQRQPMNENGTRGSFIWNFPRFDPYRNSDPSQWTYENVRLDNTSIASVPDVLRSIVVLETIEDKNLLESVRSNGAVILANARARAASLGLSEDSIQGIGMIFHFSNSIDLLFPKGSIENYEGRVTPVITTELKDWPSL